MKHKVLVHSTSIMTVSEYFYCTVLCVACIHPLQPCMVLGVVFRSMHVCMTRGPDLKVNLVCSALISCWDYRL